MLNLFTRISLLGSFAYIFVLVGCNQTPSSINNNHSELTQTNSSNRIPSSSNKMPMNSPANSGRMTDNTSIENKQLSNQNNISTPSKSSKTISYEDLISMANDAPNQIAIEEKIKDYFGEQSVLIKDIPIFQVKRDGEGRLLVQGTSLETMNISTVFYVEEKDKQKVISLKSPGNFFDESEKVNIRCTYDQVGRAKDSNIVLLKFNFVSIE